MKATATRLEAGLEPQDLLMHGRMEPNTVETAYERWFVRWELGQGDTATKILDLLDDFTLTADQCDHEIQPAANWGVETLVVEFAGDHDVLRPGGHLDFTLLFTEAQPDIDDD